MKLFFSFFSISIYLSFFICFSSFAETRTLEQYADQIYNQENLSSHKLSRQAFLYGVIGFENLRRASLTSNSTILAILDFTQHSARKRFYFFDLAKGKLIHQTYGAHGKNSGLTMAKKFSNKRGSQMSSIGFYTTFHGKNSGLAMAKKFSNKRGSQMSSIGLYTTFSDSYYGDNGISIRLYGHDVRFNDNAEQRAIVFHGAPYATKEHVAKFNRLGRSWGCPAVPNYEADFLVKLIKDSAVLFVYANSSRYFNESDHLDRSVLLEDSPF